MNKGIVAILFIITIIAISWSGTNYLFDQESFPVKQIEMVNKLYEQDEKKWMPISLDAHHALMDGYHAGLFFERLQQVFLMKN